MSEAMVTPEKRCRRRVKRFTANGAASDFFFPRGIGVRARTASLRSCMSLTAANIQEWERRNPPQRLSP
jgi:hypothetical protein